MKPLKENEIITITEIYKGSEWFKERDSLIGRTAKVRADGQTFNFHTSWHMVQIKLDTGRNIYIGGFKCKQSLSIENIKEISENC